MISLRQLWVIFSVVVVLGVLISFCAATSRREHAVWKEVLLHASVRPDVMEACEEPAAGSGIGDEFCHSEWERIDHEALDALLAPEREAAARAWFEHVLDHGWPDPVEAALEAMERQSELGWAQRWIEDVILDPEFVRRAYARHAVAAEASGVPRAQIIRSWQDYPGSLESEGGKYGRRVPAGQFQFSGGLSGWWRLRRMDWEAAMQNLDY